MKILVDKQLMNTIQVLHNKILLCDNTLMSIRSYTFEKEVLPKTFFHPERICFYLTAMKIHQYHNEGKFLGSMSDESVEWLLAWKDLYALRSNWSQVMEQIEAFGFTIVPKEL
jgi:hypothetical protein